MQAFNGSTAAELRAAAAAARAVADEILQSWDEFALNGGLDHGRDEGSCRHLFVRRTLPTRSAGDLLGLLDCRRSTLV